MSFNERRHTWINKQQGLANIKLRLDRVVADLEWLNLFLKARVQHLPLEESYHISLLISTNGEDKIYKRLFRFLQAWTIDISSF